MRYFLPFIVIATCISSPARAGWEWTRWGMTPHAVRLAAPVNLARIEEPVARSRLEMLLAVDVRTDGIDFRARLGFGELGQLGMVELRPVDAARDCAPASKALARRHGAPVSLRRAPTERLLWADADAGNLVEFRRVGGACVIRVSPLPRRKPYLRG